MSSIHLLLILSFVGPVVAGALEPCKKKPDLVVEGATVEECEQGYQWHFKGEDAQCEMPIKWIYLLRMKEFQCLQKIYAKGWELRRKKQMDAKRREFEKEVQSHFSRISARLFPPKEEPEKIADRLPGVLQRSALMKYRIRQFEDLEKQQLQVGSEVASEREERFADFAKAFCEHPKEDWKEKKIPKQCSEKVQTDLAHALKESLKVLH